MVQDVCSTTVHPMVQVLVEFVTTETDSMLEDDPCEISLCGTRCCFNQRTGCPLDQGDKRCMHGGGYYTVREVIKYG